MRFERPEMKQLRTFLVVALAFAAGAFASHFPQSGTRRFLLWRSWPREH
jgi:hypothetical protein